MTTLPPSPVPTARTPLPAEDQARIAEHVNEDHLPEMLLCARAFTPHAQPRAAEVQAIYTEGFDLRVQDAAGNWHTEFVPYPEAAGAHLGIRAAVQAAQERLGTPRAKSVDATLRVREVGYASRHMRRLTLEVAPEDQATWPQWTPGFSLLFTLGTPGEAGASAETPERYYTVRAQDLAAGTITADVYCHDNTPGSNWAQGLGAGDLVRVRGGRPERFPEFGPGALLLGDETALPTIAALLEGWAGEQGQGQGRAQGPRVLLEVRDAAEQRYLDGVCLPAGTHLSWLPAGETPGTSLLRVVQGLETSPDSVWGALEVDAARAVRAAVREDLGVERAASVVTGYWRGLA